MPGSAGGPAERAARYQVDVQVKHGLAGAGAGQTVFHLHIHLIAGRPLGWPPG